MPLPLNHPINEAVVYAHSPRSAHRPSLPTRAPCRGKVIKVGSVLYPAITTADATAATTISQDYLAATGTCPSMAEPIR
jgi:hypothetical protein